MVTSTGMQAAAPRTAHHQIGWHLRRYFLAGLVGLFPVAMTLYTLVLLFRFSDAMFGQLINRSWQQTFGYAIPGLGLVITALVVLLVGVFASHVVGRWFFQSLNAWLSRLPVTRHLYPLLKQLTTFLMDRGGPHGTLPRAVLIQYPRFGCYTMALVTNEVQLLLHHGQTPVLTLLVVHAHSPLTSPLVFVLKEEVIPLDVSLEDVLKFAVSAGVVAAPLRRANAVTEM